MVAIDLVTVVTKSEPCCPFALSYTVDDAGLSTVRLAGPQVQPRKMITISGAWRSREGSVRMLRTDDPVLPL